MEIKKLDYEKYKGVKYSCNIKSDYYLDIKRTIKGFDLEFIKSENTLEKVLSDDMLSDWLDNPISYGAFIDNELVGFVEGFKEDWNNRFRITNICVFDNNKRRSGLGKTLLDKILIDAKASNARMVVLETQSYNYNAIKFYQKNGFEIIGFDLYAYSNESFNEKNIRVEMGIKI